MMAYLIKSILTLGILYIFYWLFLRNLKTFSFNRFFILSSLVFSLIIPLVTIPVETQIVSIIPAESSLQLEKTIQFSGEYISDTHKQESSFLAFLILSYLVISLILLIRFGINFFNIFRTIRTNKSIKENDYQLILVEKQILPHSFFKFIFINQAQYKTGEINNVLIQHESTHCRQWHSIDIMIAELLKVVFWINPFIWLIRKQMQLNHEFLADQSVLTSNDITQYRHLLLNTILKNQTGILVSNFNFSFTKQRLKMMTRKFYPKRAAIIKTASIFTFVTVFLFVSCQDTAIDENTYLISDIETSIPISNNEEQWWQPILKEHGITPIAYNNFPNIFEMGTSNRINDGIVELENAFFLFRPVEFHSKEVDKNSYFMMRAPHATHDLESDSIKASNGNIRIFELENGKMKSVNHLQFSDIVVIVNKEKAYFNANNLIGRIENSEGKILKPEQYTYNLSVRW